MDEIISLISNVGFPIACCVVLFIQNSKFNEALNNNTKTLQELVNEIRRSDKKDD